MMNFGGGGQYDALLQALLAQQQARAQRPQMQPTAPMGGTMQSAQVTIPGYQGGGQDNAGMGAQTIASMMRGWNSGGSNTGPSFSWEKAWGNNFGFSPTEGGAKG